MVVKDSDLVMTGIDVTWTNYPLDILAEFKVPGADDAIMYPKLWTTSIRTLSNCMRDCYEDYLFYEQFQYAIDTRSSILFTYHISGDDRLTRQAIIQLHDSYNPGLALTASRAPSHQPQIIPHFSLFWICMIIDHFEYFNGVAFARQFLPEVDGVFEAFSRRIDPDIGLIRSLDSPSQWDFVDWTEQWKPMGIPPAAKCTGFSTYTNMLYAYVLKLSGKALVGLKRPGLADEYNSRAEAIVIAIRTYCFDGQFFTDGLAFTADSGEDYSQHCQVWAILCGAATTAIARDMLNKCLSSPKSPPKSTTETVTQEHPRFTPVSTAVSFYTLRALSLVGGTLYNDHFHAFWEPGRHQISQNLTTWVEDSVSLRSDCHAWGCVPINEFLKEVCGIKFETSRRDVLRFKPRIGLFLELDAKVPFQGSERLGVAHVVWKHEVAGVKLSIALKTVEENKTKISVLVVPSDGMCRLHSAQTRLHFSSS